MIDILNMVVLLYFVTLTAGYIAQFASAVVGVIRVRRDLEGSSPESVNLRGRATLPISILCPAYNEEMTVVDSVRALLALRYPEHEVVVINDGSTDSTMAALRAAFALEAVPIDIRIDLPCKTIRATYRSAVNRRLIVIDKENGGKSDALNCGINAARYPLVCVIDADTLIVPDALLRLVRPFLTDLDVVAVGGTLCIANGCTIERGQLKGIGLPERWLPRFQVVEYLRAFLVGRLGWDGLGGNLIVSGAFGLFRRSALIKAGGYAPDTVGEDMELVARLRHDVPQWLQGRAIRHLPDPVSFTEGPETFKILGAQRDRWQRGLMDTLWRHRRMAFNPRYGSVGIGVMPFYFVFELIGPIIELFGYIYFTILLIVGALEPLFTSLFFLLAFFSGFLLSLGGIVLEELSLSFFRQSGDVWRLLVVAFAENFGYRQMVLMFRIRGMFRHIAGNKAWGKMTRTGFAGGERQKDRPLYLLPIIVTGLVVTMLAMPIGWLVRPKSDAKVVIVNKTVPFENYREHQRLMWLLSHHKVAPPSGRLLWDLADDYVGYDPRNDKWHLLDDQDLAGRNFLYLADTYGVYTDDMKGRSLQIEGIELSREIFGGLKPSELDAIEKFVRGGGRLMAEFNSFATPTDYDSRRRMERLLHLRWTGWAGRPVWDLADDPELAEWIKERWEAENGRTWDLEGPGIIYVHESGRVAAVRKGVELENSHPILVQGDKEVSYHFWFDVIVAEEPGEVRAEFQIDTLPEGDKVLARYGIPNVSPAIVHDDAYKHVYVAGDLADGDSSLGPPWLAGLPTIRRWLANADLVPYDTTLLWTVYAPLLERALDPPEPEQ